MASDKVSKNSKKGSKSKPIMMPIKKEKPKKEFILIELTSTVAEELKTQGDLSIYRNKPVTEIVKRFGKVYLRVKNI